MSTPPWWLTAKSPRRVGVPTACGDPRNKVAAATAAAQIQGSYYLGWNVNSHVNASVATEETALTASTTRLHRSLFICRQKSETICIFIFISSAEHLTVSILLNLIFGTCFLFFLEKINLKWTDCKPQWYLIFILGLDGDKGYRLQTLNKWSAAGFIFFYDWLFSANCRQLSIC